MRLPARDRRERLARAAADLFHERGYDAVSLRDIAARAGVPAGAVFYHFPTKAALATVAADAQLNRAEEILARAAEGRSPEERLTIIATGLAAGAPLAARHGCPIQRLARDLATDLLRVQPGHPRRVDAVTVRRRFAAVDPGARRGLGGRGEEEDSEELQHWICDFTRSLQIPNRAGGADVACFFAYSAAGDLAKEAWRCPFHSYGQPDWQRV